MMRRYEWDNKELEKVYGYAGFWSEDRFNIFTKEYGEYIVEFGTTRYWHDDGTKNQLVSILLCKYENGLITECYSVGGYITSIAEGWRVIKALQLDSTQSAIQCARNPWLPTLTKAVEQGKLWIEQNNQVFTFEPDYDELVIEIWSQYRLGNGALTTMSYCANIWEDELPVNIRKAVFGV